METQNAKIISWNDFTRSFRWRSGEHVSIIGPTGSGKTTLAEHLLKNRQYVVVIATKPRSSRIKSIYRFADEYDYYIANKWPAPNNENKIVFWPGLNINDSTVQANAVRNALASIYAQGGWTVYIDETWYVSNVLDLDHMLKTYWTQGRELDISLMASTQRPRDVPLVMYSQATHVFFYRISDREDVIRISGIGSASAEFVRKTVPKLPQHTFLYVNAATGQMYISKAPKGS